MSLHLAWTFLLCVSRGCIYLKHPTWLCLVLPAFCIAKWADVQSGAGSEVCLFHQVLSPFSCPKTKYCCGWIVTWLYTLWVQWKPITSIFVIVQTGFNGTLAGLNSINHVEFITALRDRLCKTVLRQYKYWSIKTGHQKRLVTCQSLKFELPGAYARYCTYNFELHAQFSAPDALLHVTCCRKCVVQGWWSHTWHFSQALIRFLTQWKTFKTLRREKRTLTAHGRADKKAIP